MFRHVSINDLHLHHIYMLYIRQLTVTRSTLVQTIYLPRSCLFSAYLPVYDTYFLQNWLSQLRLIHD
jgi:hypothetical protein